MDGKSQGFQIRNLVHVDCNIISFIAVDSEPTEAVGNRGQSQVMVPEWNQ